MQVVLKYLHSGVITGVFTGTSEEILHAQIVADDPMAGYLLTETDLGAQELSERYVVMDGTVQAKALLTIVADPMQFHADGVDECLISVEPIVACTLRVNGMARELTTADPILELTTDTPMQFTVTLEPMPTHWSEPLTVEAV